MTFVLDQVEVGEKTTTSWQLILQLQVFSLQERMASIHWQHMTSKSGYGMLSTIKEIGPNFLNTLGKLFGVFSIQAAIALPHCHPQPPSPLPKNAVVHDQYLSGVYLNMSDCEMHIWPVPMVCNDIPCGIPKCDLPRTYVRMYTRTYIIMYFVKIDPQFRALC